MKELIDRYVRSLKERDDYPEQRTDLGALVCWILDREGFTVLERAFKHEGHERRVSKGRVQYGIDILALREEAGELVSYRLVLKRGDVQKWTPGDPGSMAADLWLSAQDKERERRYGVTPDRITVVAVHNGDRDSEGLGPVIEGTLADMRSKTGVGTDWWDAARLVDKIAASLLGSYAADASFFPPALQPFVRLTLDSLLPERGKDGSGFDLAALDLLIERRLTLRATGARGATIENADELHRRIAELSLVASMIISESTRVGGGSTLPALDALERMACGAVVAIGRLLPGDASSETLRQDLQVLLSLYIDRAEELRRRLTPLLAFDAGLAVPTDGETINYVLRSLRLSGYLATAGLAASAAGNDATARAFGDALKALWMRNEGGCMQPVTDDQLIELVLVWELWARVGLAEEIERTASRLIERLTWSRLLGFPLPGLWQRASVPMRPEHLMALVESRIVPRQGWSSAFTDAASTILPAALYVLWRRRGSLPREAISAFASKDGGQPMIPQVWAPPDDAGSRWYLGGIEEDGTTHVLPLNSPDAEFARMFEQAAVAIAPSTATRFGAEVVDRMAWKVGRTPPPMGLLVALLDPPGARTAPPSV